MPLPEAATNDQPMPGDLDSAAPEDQPLNEPRMLELTTEEKEDCDCQDMEPGERYQVTLNVTADQDGKLKVDNVQSVKAKMEDPKMVDEADDNDGLDDDRQSKMTRGPKSPGQMLSKMGSDDFQ